jgi:hypothetical protein
MINKMKLASPHPYVMTVSTHNQTGTTPPPTFA